MNQRNNQDYYVARAAKSRDLARHAKDPMIAAIHNEFATRYDLLAAKPQQATESKLRMIQAA